VGDGGGDALGVGKVFLECGCLWEVLEVFECCWVPGDVVFVGSF